MRASDFRHRELSWIAVASSLQGFFGFGRFGFKGIADLFVLACSDFGCKNCYKGQSWVAITTGVYRSEGSSHVPMVLQGLLEGCSMGAFILGVGQTARIADTAYQLRREAMAERQPTERRIRSVVGRPPDPGCPRRTQCPTRRRRAGSGVKP